MSKGSPLICLRIPGELLDQVDSYIRETADTRRAGPWTRTSFILVALREKLLKMARSRKSHSKRREKLSAMVDATIRQIQASEGG